MSRSGVVASAGGSSISDIRTSSGVFLDRGQDDVVKAIEERIAKWTLMPVGYGEGPQVRSISKGVAMMRIQDRPFWGGGGMYW